MTGGPLKAKFLFIVSLSCLLLVVPVYGNRRRSTTGQPATSEPSAQPVPAAPPPTLAQQPATPPQVSFQGGLLTISAQNSTLGDILKAVRAQTGATIDLPGTASERVVGQFGPAPARDVLTALLNGSHFNFLLLGSSTDPNALDRVILMAKSGASAESAPQPPAEQAYNQPVYRPTAPMAAPPPGSTVTVEGQDAADSSDDADDSADSTDDATDDQADQTDQGDDAAAADDQQAQPDGQQPVKTPEQLLQELQQRQQQIQQGAQPGAAPGLRQFPNPGMPGQPGQPGGTDAPPPHN
jgi:hypothetical protein